MDSSIAHIYHGRNGNKTKEKAGMGEGSQTDESEVQKNARLDVRIILNYSQASYYYNSLYSHYFNPARSPIQCYAFTIICDRI